jgi:3-methyladenine DNA glycosylase AlkC
LGGIILALAMLFVAKFYSKIMNIYYFFRISLIVEIVAFLLVLYFLLFSYSYVTALFVYIGYQLTFVFGSYLVRAETILIKRSQILTFLDVAKQFNQFDDYQQMKIIGFIATIDSPYAQKGLLNILNNPETTHINKLRSIVGISFAKHPTKETETALLNFIDNNPTDEEGEELSNSALLAIGTFSKTDFHNREELENEIISFYQNGKYSSDKITALRAMQNSNPNHFIPQIMESLKADSYKERLVAVKTLLQTDNKKEIQKILNNHLKNEKNPIIIEFIQKKLEKF